jgi:hypothetical protein
MQSEIKNSTALWGVLLIGLGAFFLLQVSGILGALSGLFWSFAFAAAGGVFLYVFLTGLHTRWWAAIPGFTLLGLAATIFYDRFAPPFFGDLGGAVFLASIGAGFAAIFFTNREHWWALIPGGALFSVAGVVLVEEANIAFLNPASVLFVGLGCTFGLLGLMSTYLDTNLRWAYIPAAIMLVLGIVIFTPFAGTLAWIWPLALIAAGAWLILRRSGGNTPSADFTAVPAATVQSDLQPTSAPFASEAEASQPVTPADAPVFADYAAGSQPADQPAVEPVEAR